MSKLIIEGGVPLSGTITASGNKNAALKLLPACLMTDQPIILHNIPDIEDVRVTLRILDDLGVQLDDLGGGSWRIQADKIRTTEMNPALAGQIRASVVFSGPMLARTGRITLPLPGGDVIGGRPLDTHVQGLRSLGVNVAIDGAGRFQMDADPLVGGGCILQEQASVTATENTLMAAVMARGHTIIENAASEPHVVDLCNFLNQMGARISGIGSNRLMIEGVEQLSGTEFTIGADFMEVGSFIGAAAVTGGEVRIRKADPHTLGMVRLVYGRMGVTWQDDGEDIVIPAGQDLKIDHALGGRIPEIKPLPWPGFPPDLMSIAVVIATQADGTIILHDWMYESRFFFVDKLVFMGARIILCDPHRVVVQGPAPLIANPQGVTSPDIRAGMAMVLAALCAKGTSTIHNIQQIDRGYQDVEIKLRELGARIKRVD
ncbi:MAG: UDP-N-acetylglucosamine 1-carboxyvinyltransferase [Anaerolineales bacterium]|nr:UDP-N-acetylglucosamine 1-carboxyvinyltransferase [Anaerolineales bacterium]